MGAPDRQSVLLWKVPEFGFPAIGVVRGG